MRQAGAESKGCTSVLLEKFPVFTVFSFASAKRTRTGKRKTAAKRQRQEEPSTSQPMSTTNEDAEPESGRSTPDTQVWWLRSQWKIY